MLTHPQSQSHHTKKAEKLSYQVVFKGEFFKSRSLKAVYCNLSQLFNEPESQISQYFIPGKHCVIARKLSEIQAEQYVEEIKHAGAIVFKMLDLEHNETSTSAYSSHAEKIIHELDANDPNMQPLNVLGIIRETRRNRLDHYVPQSNIKITSSHSAVHYAEQQWFLFDLPFLGLYLRIGRLRFISRYIGITFFAKLTTLLFSSLNFNQYQDGITPVWGVLSYFFIHHIHYLIVPFYGVIIVQRCHDLNRSGMWSFFFIVPYLISLLMPEYLQHFLRLMMITVIALLSLLPSQQHYNRYGAMSEQIGKLSYSSMIVMSIFLIFHSMTI